MARAPQISIQFKVDPEEQSGSGSMLVADRVGLNLERNAGGTPESPVVLVVDDDVELRESLVRLLAECDLGVVGAASGLDMGKQIVAEGIESAQEREVLIELGCDLLQGYLFAKPGRPFPRVSL